MPGAYDVILRPSPSPYDVVLRDATSLLIDLDGATAGAATAGGTLAVIRRLATSAAGVATVAADGQVGKPMSGAAAGLATFGADTVAVERILAAVVDGHGAGHGTLGTLASMDGDATGVAGVLAVPHIIRRLVGAAAAGATASGEVLLRRGLRAQVAGTGQVTTPALVVAYGARSQVGGLGHTSGSLPVLHTLIATASGQAVVHAAERLRLALESDASSASTVLGALRPRRGLISASHGLSVVTATPAVKRALNALAAGVSDVDGAVVVLYSLSGSSAGEGTIAAIRLGGHPPRVVVLRLSVLEHRLLKLR